MRYLLLLLLLLFIPAASLFAQVVGEGDSVIVIDKSKFYPTNLEGQPVPWFDARSLSGQQWNPQVLEGKIVLLNFWFIRCVPCLKEMGHLNTLKEEFAGEDFELISIAPHLERDLRDFLDTANYDSKVGRFRRAVGGDIPQFEVIPACKTYEREVPNPLSPACDSIVGDFGVWAYPTSVLVDREGVVQWVGSGIPTHDSSATEEMMEQYRSRIREHLEE